MSDNDNLTDYEKAWNQYNTQFLQETNRLMDTLERQEITREEFDEKFQRLQERMKPKLLELCKKPDMYDMVIRESQDQNRGR